MSGGHQQTRVTKKRLNVFEIFGNLFFVYIAYTPRACDGARCRLAKGDDRDALIFDAPHTYAAACMGDAVVCRLIFRKRVSDEVLIFAAVNCCSIYTIIIAKLRLLPLLA